MGKRKKINWGALAQKASPWVSFATAIINLINGQQK